MLDFNVQLSIQLLPFLAGYFLINMLVTIVVSCASFLVSMFLFAATFFTPPWPVFLLPTRIISSVLRGTPLLLQIMLLYYGLAALGIKLSPLFAGIFALTVNSVAFTVQSLSAGFTTIDVGMLNAARSLALSNGMILRSVVGPLVLRAVSPILVNEITVIMKATSLLSIIGVVELQRSAEQVGGATFRPLEAYFSASVLFVFANLIVGVLGRKLESRFVLT